MGSAEVPRDERKTLLVRVLRSTAMARTAVAGLALGLSALAVLAVISTARTNQTAAWIRSTDQVSEYWSKAFLSLTLEAETLNDYLLAESEREPLMSAVGSSRMWLDWLATHGSAEDREVARSAQESYASYTEMFAAFAKGDSRQDRTERQLQAALVSQAGSTLQKQAVAQMTRKRLVTYQYLNEVERETERLRASAVTVVGVDLMLLTLCAVLLLNHQRRIERQAVRDGLTGLANRTLLSRRMELAMRVADRCDVQVGLLLIDLNKFKEINDTLGHQAGDLLLQHVATRLTGSVREVDTVARLGGDEFAVLLPRVTTVEQVEKLATRVMTALQQPADLDGTVVNVQASLGAALYPLHAADADELTKVADQAMYRAKRASHDVAVHQPTDDSGFPAEARWSGDLMAIAARPTRGPRPAVET